VLLGRPLLGPVGTRREGRPRRSRLLLPGYEHPIAIGCARRWSEKAMLWLTQGGGNLCGNPGADTRHYGTASDEIAPPPEQPGWVWAGPGGGLGSDS
jgi:hypothetical protein